jgi:DNA-binding IclR family transcriptional regulator
MQSSNHPSHGWESHALSSATEINYTTQRVLRALEVVVLRPSTAPVVAEAIGIHPRTARRILGTLAAERFVGSEGARRHSSCLEPTVRLLAVAAQLASRLPLVEHGQRGVEELHDATGLGAYIAVPSYGQVIVLARAGESATAVAASSGARGCHWPAPACPPGQLAP